MKLNPFSSQTIVNIIRRHYQARKLWRNVLGLNAQTRQAEALRRISTEGLKAAKAGQLGYVQDGTSFQREFYREMWRTAAEEIGAEFHPLADTFWDVSYEGRKTRLSMHQTEFDNPVTLGLAGDKVLCHKILADGGLPVPEYLEFSPREVFRAHGFMRKHQGYFAVKPSAGTSAARGIGLFVKTMSECTRATGIASAYSQRILIERIVPGELYRLLVLRGKVIHAIRRPGIRIRGDGKSTIVQLASRKLSDALPPSLRQSARELMSDRDLLANLHSQNLDVGSIPQQGSEWVVKSYLSPMGRRTEENPAYAEDVTSLVGDEIKDVAVRAARLIRSEFAGVEVITPDTRTPLQMGAGRVIEINTTPGLGPHFDLASVSGVANPAAVVLRSLLGVD